MARVHGGTETRHDFDHTNTAPDCGSHSNTESDRDVNNDEISPKPAELSEGSSDEEPAAGEGLSEEVYEVERILDRNEVDGELFYLVRWKGFGEEDDSWEPVENLSLAVKAINEFEEKRKLKGKGRKSKTPKPKAKAASEEKSQRRSSSAKDRKGSASSKKRQSKPLLEDKTESEPETPSEDDDDEYSEGKPKKTSARASTYSGTVTKAALKSYSPTTTKADKSTPTSTRIQTVDTITAAKKVSSAELQALQMRQSWLYDSDSDEDSAPEKENEKKPEEEKLEKQKNTVRDVEKLEANVAENNKVEEPEKLNDRKRKVEENSVEKKRKKSKSEVANSLEKQTTEEPATSWERVQNGASAAPSTDEARPSDQPEIVALAQDREGRIRVLIGQDGVKKVVSLRDAHDANSWGLVQHILKFARFTDVGQ